MPTAPVAFRTERRKFPRKDVIGSQLVSVDVKPQTSSALLLDVSEGGLALQNLKAMRPGGTREVSFQLPENGNRVNVSAVVVWKDGDRAGLRLISVEEALWPVLARWIRSLPEAHPAGAETVEAEPAPRPPVPTAMELRGEEFYSVTARARVITCATGAAMAWEDAEGMICRASTGIAPATGARVQLDQGLSGECIRKAAVVRCDDTDNDPRVDPEVCRQLNLRSVVIVPVLRQGKVTGLIEVFSNKPNAFRNEDVAGLRLLADQCASGNVAPKAEPQNGDAEPLRGFSPAAAQRKIPTLKYRTFLPWIVGGLVLLGGASLAYRHGGSASAASTSTQQRTQTDLAATPQNAAATAPAVGIPREVTEAFFGKGDAAARSALRKQKAVQSGTGASRSQQDQAEDEDGITVRQRQASSTPASSAQPQQGTNNNGSMPGGADVTPPSLTAQSGGSDAGTLAALSVPRPALPSGPSPEARAVSEVTPARLIHSVKPRYPTAARVRKIEGAVLLSFKVDAFGRVKDIDVVSGNPDLAQAAVAAVRQWRYDPFKLNGKPVDGQTNVTVNFSIKEQ